jgi:hypothetical protein
MCSLQLACKKGKKELCAAKEWIKGVPGSL